MKALKRHLHTKVKAHIYKEEITLLTGSRQVGKTTMLKQLQSELEAEGRKTYFITLERADIKQKLDQHPENLFSIIPKPAREKVIVFIDEIQYLQNPTNFLKLLFDEHKEIIKLVVTGSSAFYIDRKFDDSLAGRKRIFHLSPFSLAETVESKGYTELTEFLQQDITLQAIKIPVLAEEKLRPLVNEYAVYGGYPKVVLENDFNEKEYILNELVNSFLKKDALESNIRKESEFMLFVEVLADRTGNKLNRQELGNICRISDETVLNFLYVLEKSFHISYVRPFWKSKTSELRKMPKFYFQDNGMRNALLHNFSGINNRHDKGELAENLVYSLLRYHYPPEAIQYWSTREQKEVDFIVNKLKALEVKFNANSTRLNKYKLFTETYPDIPFELISFEAAEPHRLLWTI